jgi:hypothetical protein
MLSVCALHLFHGEAIEAKSTLRLASGIERPSDWPG